jgi:thiamine biosynthesis lipoprotein ApbE
MDRAAEKLADIEQVDEIVFNFGGRLYFWSRLPSSCPTGMRDPAKSQDPSATYSITQNGALATVALADHFFIGRSRDLMTPDQPTRYSRFLNPRTGFPAEDPESVTVFSPSGTESDVLAAALLTMGRDAGMAWAEKENVSAAMTFFNDVESAVSNRAAALAQQGRGAAATMNFFNDNDSGLASRATAAWRKNIKEDNRAISD